MNFRERFGEEPAGGNRQAEPGAGENVDLVLEEALKDFRMSVHAWSEAAYSRPRLATPVVRRRSWRPAAGWAHRQCPRWLALAAGSVSGTVYQRHHRQELARIAAARAAEQQRLVREQQAREEEEDLLAKVDKDVSREVPSAMEPLAQLMAEGGQ